MLKFETIDQLNDWLTAKGIDTTCWGSGGAKSVENLWCELAEGESQLQDEPPLRLVQIVNVLIRAGNRLLVEAGQEFGESQYRYRGMPPSEKLKPGESPVQAAILDPGTETVAARGTFIPWPPDQLHSLRGGSQS
jgi:hypothetical protein